MLLTEGHHIRSRQPLPDTAVTPVVTQYMDIKTTTCSHHVLIDKSLCHTYAAYDKQRNTVCDKYAIIIYDVVAVHDTTDDKRPEYRWNIANTKRASNHTHDRGCTIIYDV